MYFVAFLFHFYWNHIKWTPCKKSVSSILEKHKVEVTTGHALSPWDIFHPRQSLRLHKMFHLFTDVPTSSCPRHMVGFYFPPYWLLSEARWFASAMIFSLSGRNFLNKSQGMFSYSLFSFMTTDSFSDEGFSFSLNFWQLTMYYEQQGNFCCFKQLRFCCFYSSGAEVL